MDAVERIRIACAIIGSVFGSWDAKVSRKTAISRDIYLVMFVYVIQRGLVGKQVTKTELQGMLCESLRFSLPTAQKYIENAIKKKYLIWTRDRSDKRKKIIVPSKELLESMYGFSSDLLRDIGLLFPHLDLGLDDNARNLLSARIDGTSHVSDAGSGLEVPNE